MGEQNKEKDKTECCPPAKWQHRSHCETGGGIYFFAIIGAAVYFIQQVSGFWLIVLAILKAIVWPAFLIHKVFTMLNI